MPRRVLVVAAVLLAAGLVLAGQEAGASVPSSPRRAAGFDGRVRVAVAVGNTIYLGGAFTRATDVDGRVVTRNRLAAVDAATAARPPGTRRPTAPSGCSPWPRWPAARWSRGATSPRWAGSPSADWPCSAEPFGPAPATRPGLA